MDLSAVDYKALADFRHAIRSFLAFSEGKASEMGLTPQQHQALLAIRASQNGEATIGYVAERLLLKPHSASELVARLESISLLKRKPSEVDGRQYNLTLSAKAERILRELSATHREELRRLRPMLSEVLKQL